MHTRHYSTSKQGNVEKNHSWLSFALFIMSPKTLQDCVCFYSAFSRTVLLLEW